MDVNKELDDIFNDPLLEIDEKERALFDVPEDMKKAGQKKRAQPEFYAQRKVCEDFEQFKPGFLQVHKELKEGKRNLIKASKTDDMIQGSYYVVDGQLVYLAEIGDSIRASNGSRDGRTRCIFENGTESNLLLQTLRKNIMANGYTVSAPQDKIDKIFDTTDSINEGDQVTGYIYVLRSLSTDSQITKYKDLYKIGFTINSVEERVANAENEPTYLMAPVKIEATYKIVNLNSHIFESLIHQVLDAVQLQLTVTDSEGNVHNPKEWFIVPLQVINNIIEKIVDGSITQYTYNRDQQCLEKQIIRKKSTFDTKGMKVLSLNIKKENFDEIMSGEKTVEYRELKQTTINTYTFVDKTDGKRYLKRFDALHLYVGYHKDREHAIVQVLDTNYDKMGNIIEYYLGPVLEHVKP